PSPFTAYGVYLGMKRAAKEVFGTDDLHGKTISVQGLGSVGFALCERLHQDGASLIVSDINSDRVACAVEKFQATAVDGDEIYDAKADIFSPNALGGTLNEKNIARLRVKLVAGGANNVLHETKDAERLAQRGIFYVPDFVINAGGVINVADELNGYDRTRVLRHIEQIIPENISEIIQKTKRTGKNGHEVAIALAKARLASALYCEC
ncbi:MAG: Glu/Leu/Phe/Val dehydrogenase family protein, partial [Bacilli bacterium]